MQIFFLGIELISFKCHQDLMGITIEEKILLLQPFKFSNPQKYSITKNYSKNIIIRYNIYMYDVKISNKTKHCLVLEMESVRIVG